MGSDARPRHLLTLLLLSGEIAACRSDPVPARADGPARAAASASAATGAPAVGPALPGSLRIFTAQLAEADVDHVLGWDGAHLWAAEPAGAGPARVLWRAPAPGVVQHVAAGDLGRGRRLYVASGTGKEARGAPLVLEEIDPATGKATPLWSHAGERNEAAHLSIGDVDRDGRPDLAFAYFATRFEVRTRHLQADGGILEGAPIRMATSRALGDLDGDGIADEVVGRLYGDDRTTPGDLRVDLGGGWISIPTDRGVRALRIAPGPDGKPALYFADGWAAAYGKEARAQLKRARWVDGRFELEPLAASADEFTFFALFAVPAAGSAAPAIVALGSHRVTLFEPRPTPPWASRTVAEVGPVDAGAVGRDAAGAWTLYLPGPETSAIPLPAIPLPSP